MEYSRGELAEYADSKAKEICEYLKECLASSYTGVFFLDESARARAAQPFLYLHRSITTEWDRGATFTLFAVDDGDLEYEPRLQHVEKCLRKLPELRAMERETAPDSMLKDMLIADIFLSDRRKEKRSAHADGRNA